VGLTFVGAAIGAGFATGQELLQFFNFFGRDGLFGIVLASALLGLFSFSVLELGRRLSAGTYGDVIRHAAGGVVGAPVDYLVTFFLFGGLVSMVAGSGALMNEQFGWNPSHGAVLLAASAAVTVIFGLEGIVDSMAILVPVMLAGTAVTGLTAALKTGYLIHPNYWRSPASAPIPFWPASAVVYASYNLVLTMAVLAPLGARLGSREDSVRGAIAGGAGLGAAAIIGYVAIASHLPEAAAYQVPMMFVAGRIHPALRTSYALIILASIYTTAVTALYGFITRVAPAGPARTAVVMAAPAAALVLASLGFTTVVRVLYPSVGISGLVLLLALAVELPTL
jgi:uncharacterized membrane protein YkvI